MNDADRRLTSQGLERKQQLLDAAAHLFAERGYAETRIIDICREAGVAKGLFYWYFDTKEAVFRDLASDLRTRLRREQARAMAGHDEPLQMIRPGAEASVRFMADHARSFALIAVENVDRQFVDDIRVGTELHADDSERLIARGIESGQIRDEDPRLLAYSVLTTVGWFAHLLHTGRLGMSIDELAAFVGRHVVCSLAASEQVVRSTLAVPSTASAPPLPA